MSEEHKPLTEEEIRRIVREEVRKMLQEPETAGSLADAVAARMIRDVRVHTGTWQRLEQKR